MSVGKYRRFVLGNGYVYGRHRPGLLRNSASRLYWKRKISTQAAEFREINGWINEHLVLPPVEAFSRGRGLSWFRSDAVAALERMRALAAIFRRVRAQVLELDADDPGSVTYEDDLQIVAIPPVNVRFRPVPGPVEPARRVALSGGPISSTASDARG